MEGSGVKGGREAGVEWSEVKGVGWRGEWSRVE